MPTFKQSLLINKTLRKFQCLLFALKRSYICYYIACMTVPLRQLKVLKVGILVYNIFNGFINWGNKLKSANVKNNKIKIKSVLCIKDNRPQVFCRIAVRNYFMKFTRKHLRRVLFLGYRFLDILRNFSKQVFLWSICFCKYVLLLYVLTSIADTEAVLPAWCLSDALGCSKP